MQVDRLVLLIVVLQAQRVSRVDMNQLAYVPIGLGPVELVAPRLLHTSDIAHGVLPGRARPDPTVWSSDVRARRGAPARSHRSSRGAARAARARAALRIAPPPAPAWRRGSL